MHSFSVPVQVRNSAIQSRFLSREVLVDFYLPANADPSGVSVLLVNDGQNMKELGLSAILADLYRKALINPLLCVAIHAGPARKLEYGIASEADHLGRGNRAQAYTNFVLEELLPLLRTEFGIRVFKDLAFAGFSLGALMALDIVWNHPGIFGRAGLFSGSFWWRSIDQTEDHYDDDRHRIMHQLIRRSTYRPGLKFFFQCGNMDETMDRNNNGIIDSIDDTLDLIKELVAKGYDRNRDIAYLELVDGRHDVATWGRAMPEFLKWGWGR